MNNEAVISGTIVGEIKHSNDGRFVKCKVQVQRLSGVYDTLPVIIPKRILSERELFKGDTISALGEFRSFNQTVDGKRKLYLTVIVKNVLNETPRKPNEIILTGYVCKPTVYRKTPFNREIADMVIAVNRDLNKSDYIPCIAWGGNARFAEKLKVGAKVEVFGRIQSREYQKKFSETDIRTKTAYEVSINRLTVVE